MPAALLSTVKVCDARNDPMKDFSLAKKMAAIIYRIKI